MTNPSERLLCVNADDLGQSAGVNRGIFEAHECGIVTSASLMVRWPAAGGAAQCARRYSALSVGLHLDLGEWSFENGAWRARYEVVALGDAAAVAAEVRRQLELFRRMCGANPTHLDSHQHVHCREPVRSVIAGIGRELGVPVRHYDSRIRYCGQFYGQDEYGTPNHASITAGALLQVIRELPAGRNELCCHPGYGADLDTAYRNERALEIQALCDPRVRGAIADSGIQLVSFPELQAI